VSAFLQGRIGFLTIPALVANALSTLPTQAADTLEVLLSADQRARQLTLNAIDAA
ncbi:1-deoxy-D-xylulose-5-phosphate reductoisomerase, partial [Streptomyces sp. PRKS01-65]|nr:1-deoxy-D-xylulose-5-phosphate reductoisomerase [Streptomyces harenosi]